jgi:phosphatidylglycerophosphatase A
MPGFRDGWSAGTRHHTAAGWLAERLATGLGVGFLPFGSGTAGAAVWGVPLALAVDHLPASFRAVLIVVLALVGVPLCTLAARRLSRGKDPSAIVLDEIISVPMTFFLVPLDGLVVLAVGFGLNRVVDILKPPPARALERLPEGFGIMADDWIAGLYSCLALHAIHGALFSGPKVI